MSTHLVLKLAATGITHWIPNKDYMSNYYSPYVGYGYGQAVGNIFGDALAGKDLTNYGLSDEGIGLYRTAADDWKQWGADNADFVTNNRDNPRAIQDKYIESAQSRGIIPSGLGDLSWSDAGGGARLLQDDPRLLQGLNPWGPDITGNFTTGMRKYISSNPETFSDPIRGAVTKQYLANRVSDLGGFWGNLFGDIGGGVGNIGTYLMELLSKASPAFKTMWANIQGRDEAATGTSGEDGDGSTTAAGGAN